MMHVSKYLCYYVDLNFDFAEMATLFLQKLDNKYTSGMKYAYVYIFLVIKSVD